MGVLCRDWLTNQTVVDNENGAKVLCCTCVAGAARSFDSSAAGPALRAVHAAVLQSAASAAAAAATADLGVGS